MTANEIRALYLKFFTDRGHAVIPPANLVPQNDPTTLFTGSGMQPLIPYLLGEEHPAGTRLVNSQPAFRTEDAEEVGDGRHTTFFEMLGNWSLGDYFKKEQLEYFFTFLTSKLKLDPGRLYVTVFSGDSKFNVARDTESVEIWQQLFGQKSIDAKVIDDPAAGMQGGRIFFYGAKKNWWARNGLIPQTMPAGELGGPDSEVFYEYPEVTHDEKFGAHCHPNCDCGRFVEIGNSVFIQYRKNDAGGFDTLPKQNVDFGGGFERLVAAAQDKSDMFLTDLFTPITRKLEELSGANYDEQTVAMQVIADHIRAGVFLVGAGVVPSNNEQGYVLRRLLRRAIRQGLALEVSTDLLEQTAPVVIEMYKGIYPELDEQYTLILDTLSSEEGLFRKTLERGVREFKRLTRDGLTGEVVFTLFDTYGFPAELSLEEAARLEVPVDKDWRTGFDRLMLAQKERSRTATTGQFKGGLADHSEVTTKYHTATHLMYRALRQVLGAHVMQRGSNITAERLRFDFSHPQKMTPEEIKQVEDIVNKNITKDWPVSFREIPTKQAMDEGAYGQFRDKYGDKVKVYTAGDPDGEWFSKEICGGPHVEHTGQVAEGGKKFKITKEESSSAGVRRIKAVLA